MVGTVKGLKSLAAPWVFCSLHTARHLMGFLLPADHVTYLLARCESPQRAKEVAAELRTQYGDDMAVYTAEEFSTGVARVLAVSAPRPGWPSGTPRSWG